MLLGLMASKRQTFSLTWSLYGKPPKKSGKPADNDSPTHSMPVVYNSNKNYHTLINKTIKHLIKGVSGRDGPYSFD